MAHIFLLYCCEYSFIEIGKKKVCNMDAGCLLHLLIYPLIFVVKRF